MKRIRNIALIISLLVAGILPAAADVPDSIDVKATEHHDSVEIQITLYEIETQLTFLMQGLNIIVEQPDTVTLSFPSAPMVKSKVKRHTNEVKAVLAPGTLPASGRDSINHVVRPDVLPLVAALNDTAATISTHDTAETTHGFKIDVDRENAVMVFSIKVPACYIDTQVTKLDLCIYSIPAGENMQEFTGRRLSGEDSPHPNGLGEGLRNGEAARRTFRKSLAGALEDKR